MDRYRCYELWQLVRQALKVPGDVLEAGVWRGGTGVLLARRVRDLTGGPRSPTDDDERCPLSGTEARTVYLADTFTGVVKTGERDGYYRGGEHSNTSVETVAALAKRLGVRPLVRILPGVFPDETGQALASQTEGLCMCHLDLDVYLSTRDAFAWVWPYLSPGGIVVFDDYGFYGCEGVTAFVEEELDRPDALVVHNLNGHAIIVKTSPSE